MTAGWSDVEELAVDEPVPYRLTAAAWRLLTGPPTPITSPGGRALPLLPGLPAGLPPAPTETRSMP